MSRPRKSRNGYAAAGAPVGIKPYNKTVTTQLKPTGGLERSRTPNKGDNPKHSKTIYSHTKPSHADPHTSSRRKTQKYVPPEPEGSSHSYSLKSWDDSDHSEAEVSDSALEEVKKQDHRSPYS